MSLCHIGRDAFNDENPVCKSCIRQGVQSCQPKGRKKKASAVSAGPIPLKAVKGWLITGLDLKSANRFTNVKNGDRIYRGYKAELSKCFRGADLHLGQAAGRKRRLVVKRYVSSSSHFFDEDNLYSSIKPMADILVSLGCFVDDKRQWMEREFVETVGEKRIEIFVEEVG